MIGMRCVSGRCSSPISADSLAPATLKYLNEMYLMPYACSHHFIIFSIISFVSPYVLVGFVFISSVIGTDSGSPYVAAVEENTIFLDRKSTRLNSSHVSI